MPAILLRFTVQGVGLGALGALLVGIVAAGPVILTLGGFIAAAGAVIGGPAGFAAGLGAALGAKVSARPVAAALGGALGAGIVVGAIVYLFGIFLLSAAGWLILGVAVVGAAVLSPLTLRWMGPAELRSQEPLGTSLIVLALGLEAAGMLVLLSLAGRTFSVSEACDGVGAGDAKETLFPPQITCFTGGTAVELISRTWYVLLAALFLIAVALTAIALVRMRRRRASELFAIAAGAASGGLALVMGIGMVAALAQPPLPFAAPRPAATFIAQPDPGKEEPIPLDPDVDLPDPVPISTAFTVDALVAAMQQLADDSFSTAGPIDDPEIPEGIQTYPVQREACGEGGVRVVLDIWFATGNNAAGLERIETYWASLGYSVLSEPGHVAAAGREPLPAENLDLLQTWDEDDLRLRLTSLCVAGP